jgi:hypothetical protein
MADSCSSDINWEPLDGGILWCADGQDFVHEIVVVDAFPPGTTSWIVIDGIAGHFVDGVLSADFKKFSYRLEAPGSDTVVDRARYQIWVKIPNDDTSTFDDWKWFVGEARRKDE